MKVYPDGPVAGASLTFTEPDSDKYWAAVEAWQRHLLVLDKIPGFQTMVLLSSGGYFSLNYVTLPDATADNVTAGLAPFYEELASLNITATNDTKVHDTFVEHYTYYESRTAYSRNDTVGNRLIPRDLVQNETRLSQLTEVYKEIVDLPNRFLYIIAYNVSPDRVGKAAGENAVIEAWRDSLYLNNFGTINGPLATEATLESIDSQINGWMLNMRDLTPGGGSYMNEATYDYPYWKEDYYGAQYDQLVEIKQEYDPGMVFWSQPAAGNDAFTLTEDGHLCKA